MNNKPFGFALTCAAFGFSFSFGQWTYSGCPNVTDNDFTQQTVISQQNDPGILEPLKMAFDMDGSGNVDIYYIQRLGEVKYYNGANQSITQIGDVNPETGNEDGLIGIALDPDFQTNNWMYLYYSHSSGFRLSRFTLNPATKQINMGSEAILLTIPSGRGRWHTSGAMQFDAYGDLWLSVGDNEMTKVGPANTNDLRGGILRIHPEDNGTYSIPNGNLWEFAADYFDNQGQSSVAAAYRDQNQTKREIFVMGTRNAYTMTLDPVRRWAMYGDCGPDQESGSTTNQALWTEEHNIVTEPSFMGWPFWTAYNKDQTTYPYGDHPPGETAYWTDISSLNPNAPVNNNPNATGVDQLLPAKQGTHSYAHSCAMTGPLYRYDGDLNNNSKLPPHFSRVWFVADFNKRGWFRAIRTDDQGQMVGSAQAIFNGFDINLPLDFQAGPDGALYVLSYSCGPWRQADGCTEISRITYTGSCQDPSLKLEQPTTGIQMTGSAANPLLIRVGQWIQVSENAGYRLRVTDMRGRAIHSLTAEGPQKFKISDLIQSRNNGLYLITIESRMGTHTEKVPFLNRL